MKNNAREKELQQQLRLDDKEALQNVYVTYREEFINYSKRYPINKADVLDIYQDAVIAMHQNFTMSQLELRSSTIKTYLFGIGKNKLYKKLKEINRVLRVTTDVGDSYENIEIDEQVPSENQKALAWKLNEISETCQSILKLFYYRGLTIDEIVAATNYKDGNTVRSQKSRCLKQLKSLFKVN